MRTNSKYGDSRDSLQVRMRQPAPSFRDDVFDAYLRKSIHTAAETIKKQKEKPPTAKTAKKVRDNETDLEAAESSLVLSIAEKEKASTSPSLDNVRDADEQTELDRKTMAQEQLV